MNFRDEALFESATFDGWAAFRNAAFNGGVTFNSASLNSTRFDDMVNFMGVELDEAVFQDANLSNSYLRNTELEGADLRDADLSGADLENAVLTRTQLYGADFRDARLHGAIFGDAHISHATTFVERGNRWVSHRRVVGYLNRLPKVDFAEPQTVIYDPRTEPHCEADEDEISNVTRAATVYQKLESLAEDNAASSLASTCFTWRKDMERKRSQAAKARGTVGNPSRGHFHGCRMSSPATGRARTVFSPRLRLSCFLLAASTTGST